MQWSCPHCGTNLKSNPDQIGSEWSFVRCHHCVKFALVKKSGINVIKVDQAPPIGTYASSQTIEPKINLNSSIEPRKITPPPFTGHKTAPNRTAISVSIAATAVTLIVGGLYLQKSGNDILSSSADPVTTGFLAETKSDEKTPIKDSIQTQAMAPVRNPEPTKPLYVEVQGKNIILRSGPGQHFPMLTLATDKQEYKVVDWKNQWFKVEFKLEDKATLETAWVRNDLVKLISKQDHTSIE